ncbi:50S ribosomal protein L6, partial [Wolbachia endosymbiont of Pentidionis agamae]|uniref:50S ribosomal protein L6 n=1 Tax=Wolbachia endosymbiont of Pentidionis agamae TaxID=3110435 RepID=UPI002FD0917D
ANVSVECKDNRNFLIKGSKGIKEVSLHDSVVYEVIGDQLCFSINPKYADNDKTKPMLGTCRSNINSIILGLVNNFTVELEIIGVGYKAANSGKYLTLSLGYSHNIKYKLPDGVQAQCVKNQIILSSINKQKIYSVASDICKLRKYNPYKGKGIVLKGKFMLRKTVNKKK